MVFQDTSRIIGGWHFEKIGNPQNIGPQVGDGELIGGKDNSRVWLELNPQYRDNNLQLVGNIEGNQYSGDWFWITIIGVTNKGSFIAIKDHPKILTEFDYER